MTDLTDRMRTCAAAILAGEPTTGWVSLVMHDAADLLIEASNALEAAPAPLGEPMEIIPPVTVGTGLSALTAPATWLVGGDTLPVARPPSARACPRCDSRANKTVKRMANTLMLVCPVCAHAWPYTKKPPAAGTAGGQD